MQTDFESPLLYGTSKETARFLWKIKLFLIVQDILRNFRFSKFLVHSAVSAEMSPIMTLMRRNKQDNFLVPDAICQVYNVIYTIPGLKRKPDMRSDKMKQ